MPPPATPSRATSPSRRRSPTPHGRWADRLRAEFLAAAQDLDGIGEPGELAFYPDRTWHGYTYIPVTARTANGLRGLRLRALRRRHRRRATRATSPPTPTSPRRRPSATPTGSSTCATRSSAAGAAPTAPVASMTLVWGRALVAGGARRHRRARRAHRRPVRAVDDRFTLLAPDDFADGLLEVRLYSDAGERAGARVALRRRARRDT